MTDENEMLKQVGETLAKALGTGPSDARRLAQQRDLLSVSATVPRSRKKQILAWSAASAALIAGACLIGFYAVQQPLHFWLGEQMAKGNVGSRLETPQDRELPIVFEGGSTLVLGAKTSATIVSSTRKNVRVALADGTVRARIKGDGKTSWVLHAGPYQVSVLGTIFNARWNATTSVFKVGVEKGLVLVSGTRLNKSGIRLAAGNHLIADGDSVTLSPDPHPRLDNRPDTPVDSSNAEVAAVFQQGETIEDNLMPRERASDRASDRGSSGAARKSQLTGKDHSEDWVALCRSKNYASAIEVAAKVGIKTVINRSDVEDLWQLANAARYMHRDALAKQLLLAIRQRFGNSLRGQAATFLLGRVEIELRENPITAQKWFRTYLRENPKGPLREEALGRLMDACHKAGQTAEATDTARRYQSLYPNGAFSEMAQFILTQ
ncbi:MAG: FecR domain-containing protein [Myxococcota bacterium]|nr:FecR domain-containing protein [Myxococcota bacterium]